MRWSLDERALRCDDRVVLEGLGKGLRAVEDPLGNGVFLEAEATESNSRLVFELGSVPGLDRFTACHRYEPYWMKAAAGASLAELPSETQSLIVRLRADEAAAPRWVLVVPLFGERLRFSLRAARDGFAPSAAPAGRLELLAETGDPFSPAMGGLAAYVALGSEPFELCARGARSVVARLGTGRLRAEKPTPDFCERFGWCTWDAFYQEVSHDKVREGLEAFRRGGVEPRWLVLDDGWQSVRRRPTGEQRLVAFEANSKFPGGLEALCRMAKEEFGVERLLVWHNLLGYWGGTDGDFLPEYEVENQVRRFGEGILEHRPRFNEEWWGAVVGLPAARQAGAFFDDYHAELAAEGVDGVKVDGQAVLEGIATGQGGRVPLTLTYRRALEESVTRHFEGRVLHCMANGQESWYAGRSSTLLRSSIDFFPNVPETHGEHLYANAQVGVWFGRFMQPDWDMFQSGHEWGAFHAAARALCGGPIYVSDRPGAQDFELLQRLVFEDGSVARCDAPAVPTASSLCCDPTREAVLLQLQNRCEGAVLLGLFNCRTADGQLEERAHLDEVLEPRQEYACWMHQAAALRRVTGQTELRVALGPGHFELLTLVPIVHGFAALGLVDKFNPRGAVAECAIDGASVHLALRGGGRFVALSERAPTRVELDGNEVPHRHDPATSALRVALPEGGPYRLSIAFDDPHSVGSA